MGLIGGFFVPLTIASGYDAIDLSLLPKKTTCVFISPIEFVKDPSVWIHLMSKYESTMTQAPDFAFALAARKFSASDARNAETLRLHSLRHVLNASEPVRSQTVNDFLDVFQRYGLKKSSLRVGYGLAEVCVYATEHPVEFFRANRDALESGDVRMAKEAKNGELFIEVACIGVNSHKHFKILNFDSESEVKTPGQLVALC
jgi:acyl-CoA synthetase (AMP-forming)/AMP-acid ligase II